MLSITKTFSPLYPEKEYRHQQAWVAQCNAEPGIEQPFPFLGSAPTAMWFSTSESCEEDFGVRSGAEIDFDMEFKPLYAGFLADGRKLRCLTSVRNRSDKARSSFPVQAFDLTFSAPKCLSLLFAAALVRQDLRSINAFRRFHKAAVEKSLRRFRDVFVHSRSGAGGKMKHKGGEILAAVFTHFDARPTESAKGRKQAVGDPQLHSHVYLLNTVRCLDGKHRALDATHFLRKRKQIGLWFRSYLGKLLRKAGYKVLPVPPIRRRVAGGVIISGIPEVVENHFSRRSAQIQEYLGESGHTSHSASRRCEAAIRTRKGKNRHRAGPLETWAKLLQGWMDLLPRVHNPDGVQVGLHKDVAVEDVVSEILSEHGESRTTWNLEETEEYILARSIGLLDPDDLQAAMISLEAKGRLDELEVNRAEAARGINELKSKFAPNADGGLRFAPAPKLPKVSNAKPAHKLGPVHNLDGVADQQSARLLRYFLERDASDQFDVILAWADIPETIPGGYQFLRNLLEVPLTSAPPALLDLMRAVAECGLERAAQNVRAFPDRFSRIARRAASGRDLLHRHGMLNVGEAPNSPPTSEADDGPVVQSKNAVSEDLRPRKIP
jgi:conjugative relaxase-like TrwC/TraI family protein